MAAVSRERIDGAAQAGGDQVVRVPTEIEICYPPGHGVKSSLRHHKEGKAGDRFDERVQTLQADAETKTIEQQLVLFGRMFGRMRSRGHGEKAAERTGGKLNL